MKEMGYFEMNATTPIRAVIWNADALVRLNQEEKDLVRDFICALRPACKTVLLADDWPCLVAIFTRCWDLFDQFDELVLVCPAACENGAADRYALAAAQLALDSAEIALVDCRAGVLERAGAAGLHVIAMSSLSRIGSGLFELLEERV
jgi:hypothetical protein